MQRHCLLSLLSLWGLLFLTSASRGLSAQSDNVYPLSVVEETAQEISNDIHVPMLIPETWEKELDDVVNQFKSIAQDRRAVMTSWEQVFTNATTEQELMYSALKSYRECIARAMIEIESARQHAKEVLAHRAALEAYTQELRETQIG